MTSFVNTMADTWLWDKWNVEFIASHCPGSVTLRLKVFLAATANLVWMIVFARPRLVHLHCAHGGSFYRKALLLHIVRTVEVPAILHIHAGRFAEFYGSLSPLRRRFARFSLRRANAVVALGDRWAQRIRDIEPRARVVSINNAVRIPREIDRKHDESLPITVVYLGKIVDAKGVFDLLRAWELVQCRVSSSGRLVIAGDGEVDRAQEMIQDLELGQTVELVPWLSPGDVSLLLSRAGVLVLPSYFEGQSLAVLEAMAHGVSVVATRVGGLPDLIADGVNGVLVPVNDPDALSQAITGLICDEERRVEYGRRGRRIAVESFGSLRLAEQLDELYLRLASAP